MGKPSKMIKPEIGGFQGFGRYIEQLGERMNQVDRLVTDIENPFVIRKLPLQAVGYNGGWIGIIQDPGIFTVFAHILYNFNHVF